MTDKARRSTAGSALLFRLVRFAGVQDFADRHWLSMPVGRIMAGVADDMVAAGNGGIDGRIEG
ncbi:hypothetical protein JQ616_05605 [Bradyrhizobium tropiciagri]|uniref:hypothetical protein n=1 Tax=Bradyrhizobium tropiciagri TaxID=312253 RepID=UPI001BA53F04|nr:hypothetical protein [Bradyrhizobium tropiciagri]MBR0894419.1 hypothetical protein [Bradyrhizobium tropiciagri]